ncbi:hypothetical protein MNV49_004835 [Pseudohyphozyma bogoriensis]|nr:hypothetical protein MNV49_004835 [Pseudohyphozyma bogoriensis]
MTSDGWHTRLRDDSSDDEDDATPAPRKALSEVDLLIDLATEHDNEGTRDAAAEQEDEPFDLGQVEEKVEFKDNPFAIAARVAAQRKRARRDRGEEDEQGQDHAQPQLSKQKLTSTATTSASASTAQTDASTDSSKAQSTPAPAIGALQKGFARQHELAASRPPPPPKPPKPKAPQPPVKPLPAFERPAERKKQVPQVTAKKLSGGFRPSSQLARLSPIKSNAAPDLAPLLPKPFEPTTETWSTLNVRPPKSSRYGSQDQTPETASLAARFTLPGFEGGEMGGGFRSRKAGFRPAESLESFKERVGSGKDEGGELARPAIQLGTQVRSVKNVVGGSGKRRYPRSAFGKVDEASDEGRLRSLYRSLD